MKLTSTLCANLFFKIFIRYLYTFSCTLSVNNVFKLLLLVNNLTSLFFTLYNTEYHFLQKISMSIKRKQKEQISTKLYII